MNHELFLSDLITSLPELNGAFIYTPQAGVVASHLDSSVSSFGPPAIGEKLARIAAVASEHFDDVDKIQVSLDTMVLSGRLLPEQSWLFLLHTPELSNGMIQMTLQLAINNSKASESEQQQPPEATDVVDEPPVLPEVKQVDLDALIAAGSPLSKPLNDLREELANVIGPAAHPVLQDVLSTWCQDNTLSVDTLNEVVPLLDLEIESKSDISTFHNNLKHIFPQE